MGRLLGPALRAAQRPRRCARRPVRGASIDGLVEERLELAPGLRLSILRPPSAEELIDEAAFDEEEFLPYWAELWPSGVALARHVAARELSGLKVLELGCGLGLPALAATMRGADVLATDWADDATRLLQRNAEQLAELLPQLGGEVVLAEPGRPYAKEFLARFGAEDLGERIYRLAC